MEFEHYTHYEMLILCNRRHSSIIFHFHYLTFFICVVSRVNIFVHFAKNIVTIQTTLHFCLGLFYTIQINQLFERLIKLRTNFYVNLLFYLLKLEFESLNIVRVSWKCYSLIIF